MGHDDAGNIVYKCRVYDEGATTKPYMEEIDESQYNHLLNLNTGKFLCEKV